MEAKQVTGNLRRMIDLWRIHAHLDLMWMTRDMKYFLICYISGVFVSIASVTAMLLLAERFNGIGHWSKEQIMFMLGYASLVRGFMDVMFGYNILYISRRLGRGQLDHTLIQPQPVWMTLLTEGFTPFQGTCALIPGVVLVLWSMGRMSLVPTWGWSTLFGLDLVSSCAVLVSFSFIWGSLAFWAPRGAEEISMHAMDLMFELKPFPLDGVGPMLAGTLLSLMPVGFVAWYPCRSLLGLGRGPITAVATPIAAVALTALAVSLFRKGMKHYGKTGSQRYLSWGHRS